MVLQQHIKPFYSRKISYVSSVIHRHEEWLFWSWKWRLDRPPRMTCFRMDEHISSSVFWISASSVIFCDRFCVSIDNCWSVFENSVELGLLHESAILKTLNSDFIPLFFARGGERHDEVWLYEDKLKNRSPFDQNTVFWLHASKCVCSVALSSAVELKPMRMRA